MNSDIQTVGGAHSLLHSAQQKQDIAAGGARTPTRAQDLAGDDEDKLNSSVDSQSPGSQPQGGSSSSGSSGQKLKSRYKGKGVDANGRPRNFYNPPGKVLRNLSNYQYYDSFFGNQGQIYTLKQKFKTQMCKHFMDTGVCSLQQFCQFAHGPKELRQPNDVSTIKI